MGDRSGIAGPKYHKSEDIERKAVNKKLDAPNVHRQRGLGGHNSRLIRLPGKCPLSPEARFFEAAGFFHTDPTLTMKLDCTAGDSCGTVLGLPHGLRDTHGKNAWSDRSRAKRPGGDAQS